MIQSVLGRSILLRTSSTDTEQQASALLRAAGNEVIVESKQSACLGVLEAGGVDLVVLDCTDEADVSELSDEAFRRGVPVIVLSDHLAVDAVEMFCDGRADNLIYGRERVDAAVVTAEKLLRDEFFGLDKYVGRYGVEVYQFELSGGASLRSALECLDEFLSMIQATPVVAAEVVQVATELGENAMYSAPREENGRRRYRPVDRQSGRELDPWEKASLSYAFDGKRILLAVSDWFGSLEVARVRNALGKGSRKRADTAPGGRVAARRGRGLRNVWERCSELVFNISPGKQTEIIATRELRETATRCGLHLHFEGDLHPAQINTPNTIRVSDSMLVDIRQHIATRKAPPAIVLEPKAKDDKEWEDTLTDPQGRILAPDENPVGIDTLSGLLNGSTSLQRALEIGLRFMTVCYSGAVAFAIRDDKLEPLMAAGEVENWPELRDMQLSLYDDCRLADMTRSALSGRYRPSPAYRMDAELAKLVVGEGKSSVGYLMNICLAGVPSFVLYGFGPRYARHVAGKVAGPFQRKLTEVIGKHLGVQRTPIRRVSTGS